ncbi:MAG: hypothetical protein DMG07_29075, partial [Acidobacteria bacterium]
MPQKGNKFRTQTDLRQLPAYPVAEGARFLGIPASTLRSWVAGRKYPTRSGVRIFRPIIALAGTNPALLSFVNLVEAHVLDAIRQEHEIPLPKVRAALNYVARQFPSPHPLATQEFETDGLNLFVERYGQLINVSQAGQLALRRLLEARLRRIERDTSGFPSRLYP